ncbi:hypothetical protein myaer87_17600 [Microcystis aeruginosa NIES-87]|jgi:hypothetical protein|uniref:hypothetical protein n=1 Tax=Microcystis TaxID=1125 RepID=UPI000CB07FD9|nr:MULTISPECIES: hypothetical protein [Microcystis]MCA2719718.1 hypothetical protein [Microcystis sp. M169S2]WNF15492.1 hypothetical protein RKE53_03390 [Microcystis aeruginosa NRERC-214]GBE74533.1 hypothetical protein myaer87_17600 [Microcystis aeruginosa NIES-87]
MASIKIDSDLRPIGSELFLDSESYLEELSDDQQINKIVGGTSPTTVWFAGGLVLGYLANR